MINVYIYSAAVPGYKWHNNLVFILILRLVTIVLWLKIVVLYWIQKYNQGKWYYLWHIFLLQVWTFCYPGLKDIYWSGRQRFTNCNHGNNTERSEEWIMNAVFLIKEHSNWKPHASSCNFCSAVLKSLLIE